MLRTTCGGLQGMWLHGARGASSVPARVLGLVNKTPDLDPCIRSISGPHQGCLFWVLTVIMFC